LNNELFFILLKDHFFQRKPAGKLGLLLIFDGHSPHSSLEATEFAEKNDMA
jgi:hypothetical protein